MTIVTAEGTFPVAVCPSCRNLVVGEPSECWNGVKHSDPVPMVAAEAVLVERRPTSGPHTAQKIFGFDYWTEPGAAA